MARQRIQVETLQIRLPPGMTGDAPSIAVGCGREIIKSIAEALRGKSGEIRIDKLSAATIKRAGNEADVRKRSAEEVSAAVKKRFG